MCVPAGVDVGVWVGGGGGGAGKWVAHALAVQKEITDLIPSLR